jgi:hypothetical protein
MEDFLQESVRLRYTEDQLSKIDISSLGLSTRIEDEGNNLFNVFNRIQENLTSDIKNKKQDIYINQQLSDMASQYAISA